MTLGAPLRRCAAESTQRHARTAPASPLLQAVQAVQCRRCMPKATCLRKASAPCPAAVFLADRRRRGSRRFASRAGRARGASRRRQRCRRPFARASSCMCRTGDSRCRAAVRGAPCDPLGGWEGCSRDFPPLLGLRGGPDSPDTERTELPQHSGPSTAAPARPGPRNASRQTEQAASIWHGPQNAAGTARHRTWPRQPPRTAKHCATAPGRRQKEENKKPANDLDGDAAAGGTRTEDAGIETQERARNVRWKASRP